MRPKRLRTTLVDEHEQELDLGFRRGFSALCVSYLMLGGAGVLYSLFVTVPAWVETGGGWPTWSRPAAYLIGLFIVAWFLFVRRRSLCTRRDILSASTVMIFSSGTLLLAALLLRHGGDVSAFLVLGAADLLVLHLVACATLPWTSKESLQPMVPLLLVWGGGVLLARSEWDMFTRAVLVMSSPLLLVPGAALAAWRVKRYEEHAERVMLGRQVRSIGGELSKARIVHDAMFPRPLAAGHIHFEYDYQPIQEIGGDYVHCHVCRATGRTCMTLLDVAGHGLAAALTVNRLFGELERIRAENPDAEPATVMELLNRYINLTMAPHDMYATGTCIQLDPATGELKWVNAGHPPAFVRRLAGDVTDLPSTTLLLGAQSYAEFDPNQQTIHLEPGDSVIAYTDGAFEARDKNGRRYGIAALREIAAFNPPPRSWTRFISSAVAEHHQGHAEDDVLIASLTLQSLEVTRAERSPGGAASRRPDPQPATPAAPVGIKS
jgi:serine phosphatase RsbU (regulator of sigma subunit)